MNLVLAVEVGQWILLGVLVLILVISPFLMKAKNKKEMENAQKLIDSIKKGDKVLTASGVIGKVISLDNKDGYRIVTIETGDEKHKGYITLDIAAIYANLSNPVVEQKLNEKNANENETENLTEETKTDEGVDNEQNEQKLEKAEGNSKQSKKNKN